jgi:hypothetical protein
MHARVALFGAIAVLSAATPAAAQVGFAVQLPTISFFAVSTTVSVPDSGAGFAGGSQRGRMSRGIGLFDRGIASGAQAGGAQVGATIIDHEEHDRLVLSGQGESAPPRDPLAEQIAAGQADGPRGLSVAEARRRRQAARDAVHDEGLTWLARARECEADGRVGSARAYYRMAARRLQGDARHDAVARLRALSPSP